MSLLLQAWWESPGGGLPGWASAGERTKVKSSNANLITRVVNITNSKAIVIVVVSNSKPELRHSTSTPPSHL